MKINPEAQLAVKLLMNRKRPPCTDDSEAQSKITSYEVCEDAARLMSMARALRRLDMQACNRPLSSREQRRMASIQGGVGCILDGYGLQLKWTRDTTDGTAVRIHFPDGSYNTTGGPRAGWGI